MSKQSKDIMTVKPSELMRFLKFSSTIKRPVFIWGPPGVGKSDIIKQLAESMSTPQYDVPLYDVRLLIHDPIDLRGLPFVDNEKSMAVWADPAILPPHSDKVKAVMKMYKDGVEVDVEKTLMDLAKSDGKCILFLDELTAAEPMVQAAAYQLVHDRRVGSYILPENTIVVGAGNRQSDRGISFEMPSPLRNRFVQLELRADADDWIDWAGRNDVSPYVIGYIKENPAALFDEDFSTKSNESRAFRTPRSWNTSSDYLKKSEEVFGSIHEKGAREILGIALAGNLGLGTSSGFSAWVQHSEMLPNTNDVITGKVKELDPRILKTTPAQYYLAVSMCMILQKYYKECAKAGEMDRFNRDYAANFFNILNDKYFRKEIIIFSVKMALSSYGIKFGDRDPLYIKFLKENKEIISMSM